MSEASELTPEVSEPVKTSRFLLPEQRIAIAAAVASGRSQTDVALEFGVSCMTVSRIIAKVRHATTKFGESADWKSLQKKEAVTAVNAGLRDETDSYKRATIGVNVLKGLGEYQEGTQTNVVNIFTSMQDLPEDWQRAYEERRMRNVTPEESSTSEG